ncbi:MAG: UDP-N-acetylmuramate--L-alanine ligase [Bacteroidales bacterium]|nr:UDP-N-acetylmuramate--L-alanine ligase [Bacteroidales bacterium]
MTELKKHIFFLGIGGIGMSALARFYARQGVLVEGYDLTPTALTAELEEEGIRISFTDTVDFIQKRPDLVIYTPAIPKENNLFHFFIDSGILMQKRSVALGEITNQFFTIAIAGTHGKTSITSMVAHILQFAKKNVTAFIGGIAKNYKSNLILSQNPDYLVVEADEFDRSFLTLAPDIAVISSMDADHLDIYGKKESLVESFVEFAAKIKSGGKLFAANHLQITVANDVEKIYYGFDSSASIIASKHRIENGRTVFELKDQFGDIFSLNTFLPGQHNMANLSAAVGIASQIGIDKQTIEEAVSTYTGVSRRFDVRLINDRHIYIDDYAHHPTEIEATLKAVKSLFPNKKTTVIFQPHLFSRTRDFAEEFAKALSLADMVFLMPIYPAREKPMEGVNSEWLLKMITTTCRMTGFESVVEDILKHQPELLLTLGAGSIDRIVEPLENALR